MSQHSVGRTRNINLPAELGWISKNLPLGPRPLGCALGPQALGQFFTDPPSICYLVREVVLTPLPVPLLLHLLVYFFFRVSTFFNTLKSLRDSVEVFNSEDHVPFSWNTLIRHQGSQLAGSKHTMLVVLVQCALLH